MGNTEFTDYNDRLFLSAGVARRLSPIWSPGLNLRYKNASLSTRDDQRSIGTFLTHKIDPMWQATLHATYGLTDAVADSSFGLQLTFKPRPQCCSCHVLKYRANHMGDPQQLPEHENTL